MQAVAERRLGFFGRYASNLSRNHPVIWATRFDIVIFYFLLALIAFQFVMATWHPDFGDAKAGPYTEYPLRQKLGNAYLSAGVVTIFVAFFWISSKLGSLQLPYSPRLRRIPWAIEAHVATLLMTLPMLGLFLKGISDIFDSGSYNSSAVGQLVGALAIASFLACFATLARRFGFQNALAGAMSLIAAFVLIFLAIVIFSDIVKSVIETLRQNFLSSWNSEDVGFLILLFIIFAFVIAACLLAPRRSSKFKQFAVLYPAFYGASTGPLTLSMIPFIPEFDVTPHSIADVLTLLGKLLAVYALSAILTQIMFRRFSRHASLG